MFEVTCLCNTLLEVGDGETVVCGNCGREYDDRGNELYPNYRDNQEPDYEIDAPELEQWNEGAWNSEWM